MKKIVSVIILAMFICISAFSLTACDDSSALTFYMPDGAPAIAFSKCIYDNDNLGVSNGIDYKIVSGAEISGAITTKSADFVLLPINTATKLYNQTENEYVMLSVITHGNFYIVSSFNITSANDLIGKIIYTPMRGKVPDWTLQASLINKSIEYTEVSTDQAVSGKVAIRYFNEGADVLKAMPVGGNTNIVGLLPEPAVTNIKNKKPVYQYQLSLQSLYNEQSNSYPQAVLMAKKATLDKCGSICQTLQTKVAESVLWAKSNINDAVDTIKAKFNASSLDKNSLTAQAIDNCNIYWQSSTEAKTSVLQYIEDIRNIDSSSANQVGKDFFN